MLESLIHPAAEKGQLKSFWWLLPKIQSQVKKSFWAEEEGLVTLDINVKSIPKEQLSVFDF